MDIKTIPKFRNSEIQKLQRQVFGEEVSFSPDPYITYIEQSSFKISKRSTLKMSNKITQMFEMEQMNDSILQEAALLFSNNYGIWGERAKEFIGPFAKQGLLRLSSLDSTH